MKNKVFVLSLMFLIALGFSSCKKDESSEKEITSFKINEVEGIIEDMKISVGLPAQTDLTKLTALVSVSGKASVSPASGETIDFTDPVAYTVTAEDGSRQTYTVTVTKTKGESVNSFVFEGLNPPVAASIDDAGKTISAVLPYGTDLTKLVPSITLSSDKASVSPASGKVQDFSQPVNYVITDADGNATTYIATIKVESLSDKDIRSFVFGSFDPVIYGVINEELKTITLTVPYSKSLQLAPTITIPSRASVSPRSGETVDFSQPVEYTVTAGDQSKAKYTVTVIMRDFQPEITWVTSPVQPGNMMEVAGTFGSKGTNTVTLSDGGNTYALNLETDTDELLMVQIPSGFSDGSYTVSVTTGGMRVDYQEKVEVKVDENTRPVISGFEKNSYTAYTSEAIVVLGKNLYASNTLFLHARSVTGGVSDVYLSGNTDGKQASVPAEFLAELGPGEYTVWASANGIRSNEVKLSVVANELPAPRITSVGENPLNEICADNGNLLIRGENFSTPLKVYVVTPDGQSVIIPAWDVHSDYFFIPTIDIMKMVPDSELKIKVVCNGKETLSDFFRLRYCLANETKIENINGGTGHVVIKRDEEVTLVGRFPVSAPPVILIKDPTGSIVYTAMPTYYNHVEVKFGIKNFPQLSGSPDLKLELSWDAFSFTYDNWIQIL